MNNLPTRRAALAAAALVTTLLLAACAGEPPRPAPDPKLARIGQIVVVYLENRSFDHLFGRYPGAEGIEAAIAQGRATQVGADGTPLAALPPIRLAGRSDVDPRFPREQPNAPFRLDPTIALADRTPSPIHTYFTHRKQINGGRNDRFVVEGNTGSLVMGHFDGQSLGLWSLARRYTLADHFFMSAFGGSYLNHFWLVCACTPLWPDAPKDLVALDDTGRSSRPAPALEPSVTTDGYAVNTTQGPWLFDPSIKQSLLPPQTAPTIGDRLSARGIAWAYYAQDLDRAVAAQREGKGLSTFSYHHQPFTYFKRFVDSADERARHLKDRKDLLPDIAAGRLPPVAFYKPTGGFSLHPGSGAVAPGDAEAMAIVESILAGPQAKDTVIVVTFDENGGFWDHVAPPVKDRFGPGSRVPTIIVSPWSTGGRVDHTEYETVSILKLIEERFGLAPLGERDAKATSLARALAL